MQQHDIVGCSSCQVSWPPKAGDTDHVTGPAAHELINISPAHPLRRPQHANPTRDRKERPDHESGVVFPHPFRYPLLMAVGPSPRPLPQEISFRCSFRFRETTAHKKQRRLRSSPEEPL
ncbi:hypothetical protein B296_00047090, partial [Ensete ventricosum]